MEEELVSNLQDNPFVLLMETRRVSWTWLFATGNYSISPICHTRNFSTLILGPIGLLGLTPLRCRNFEMNDWSITELCLLCPISNTLYVSYYSYLFSHLRCRNFSLNDSSITELFLVCPIWNTLYVSHYIFSHLKLTNLIIHTY